MSKDKYHVFLSHNSADKDAVEVIARRLRAEAQLVVFLDRWHLIPGEPWQEALEAALNRSATVAVFVGPSGISPWHNEEMRAALDHAVRGDDEYRLIPVLLPGAPEGALGRFIARRTWVDFRPGLNDTAAFARLVAGILGQPPEQADPFVLPDEPAPYPGLLPFTTQQASFFFGRADDCDKLLRRVHASPFVAVVGASGSGKSSLVLAGLLPRLDQGWHSLTFVPGARPLRSLADQLATLGPMERRLGLVDELEGRLADRVDGLSTVISTLLADRADITTLLLVVDQVEELFTQVTGLPAEVDRQRHQFIVNLVDATRTVSERIRVVLTLRADFVGHCLEFPDLRALLEANQFLLGPMVEEAFREVIVKPAQTVGAMFEKGLVGRVIDDMHDQPGALPLLQFTLAQLWQQRQGVWLTHAAYESIGGVTGSIDQTADAVYQRLSKTQQNLARNLFVRLVALGKNGGDTRRRIHRDELYLTDTTPEELDQLIDILSHRDVRLIVAETDTIELTHEALIEEWGQLREWLAEDRAGLLIHRNLTETAMEWDQHNRDSGYLYRGGPLIKAQIWSKDHSGDLNPVERAFLEHSLSAQRRARALRLVVRLTIILVVAGLLWAMITELGPFSPRIEWTSIPEFNGLEVSNIVWENNQTIYLTLGTGDSASKAIARSEDGGLKWEFLNLPGRFASNLVLDPNQPDVIFAALEQEGLYRSQDGGVEWEPIGRDFPFRFIDALTISPRGILYTGDFIEPSGVYASHDQGDSWEPLPGSPKTNIQFLRWMNDHLVIGTGQGLWQWSKNGQWVRLLDQPVSILSAVGTSELLVAGGDGIYQWHNHAVPEKISNEQVKTIGVDSSSVPLFVAGTRDNNILLWRMDDTSVRLIARNADLEETPPFIYVIKAPPNTTAQFWIGTDNGLRKALVQHWFQILGP